jgi:hypothetical protein
MFETFQGRSVGEEVAVVERDVDWLSITGPGERAGDELLFFLVRG